MANTPPGLPTDRVVTYTIGIYDVLKYPIRIVGVLDTQVYSDPEPKDKHLDGDCEYDEWV